MLDKLTEVSTEIKLKNHHYQAVDLIIAGKTDQEIAGALNVARETVTRWRNDNYYFMAELNRRREILLDSAADRLKSLTDVAIDIIYDELFTSGDFKSAIEFLKVIGIYGQVNKPNAQTDPRIMIIEDAHRKSDTVIEKLVQSGKSQKQKDLVQKFIEEALQRSDDD